MKIYVKAHDQQQAIDTAKQISPLQTSVVDGVYYLSNDDLWIVTLSGVVE